jgi:hypothetical protein
MNRLPKRAAIFSGQYCKSRFSILFSHPIRPSVPPAYNATRGSVANVSSRMDHPVSSIPWKAWR